MGAAVFCDRIEVSRILVRERTEDNLKRIVLTPNPRLTFSFFSSGCYIFLRMSKLFTTEDAAKYLGVTPSRVRQFIMEDRLESEKYGRDHLIREADLQRFVKNGKRKRGRPKKAE